MPDCMYPLPMYDRIEKLQSLGKKIYALTNYPEPSFTTTAEMFPKLKQFDGVVVSSREKMVKPDGAIFRLLRDRFHLTPENTLFVDDTLVNVQAAEKEGFRVWHYTGENIP